MPDYKQILIDSKRKSEQDFLPLPLDKDKVLKKKKKPQDIKENELKLVITEMSVEQTEPTKDISSPRIDSK